MICSKCKQDKPADQYYTYWHSNHKKHYTRKVCTDCTTKQTRECKIRMKIKNEIVPEGFKKCNKCQEIKAHSEYYRVGKFKSLVTICKKCYNKRQTRSVWEKLDYKPNPNEWTCDEQRDIVHQILRNLNWSFNTEKQIWYKLPFKDKDGKWNITVKEPVKVKRLSKENIILNVEEIVKYREQGLSYAKIGDIYNVSHVTIKDRLMKYYRNGQGKD